MKIILADLELTAEHAGGKDNDCYIVIQIKDDPNVRKVKASELVFAVEALNKISWRP